MTTLSFEQIASITHEANRALQIIMGDPAPSPHWDDAPDWQRASAIDGVRGAIDGNSPEQSHASWLAFKADDGWTYGPVKDFAAKTHPCIVPYTDLPFMQRLKDDLFVAIVDAVAVTF